MARERPTRSYFAHPEEPTMSRFLSGRVLRRPLNEIGRVSTGGLADAYLADIKSSNLAEKVTFSSADAECGENLGPEKHEIRDGKRRHRQTKAPNQHVADGRTELRSARLFCRLDDLAVFLFSNLSSLQVLPSRLTDPRGQRAMLGDVPKPSAALKWPSSRKVIP
jgi:hypothetical protein